MNATLRRGLVIALALIATTAAISAQRVTRVIDGDTIEVEGIGPVRLIGVDTPETVDPRKPVQFFGAEASAFTTKLAQGQRVRLELEGAEKDKYNRTLAYVYLPDGTLLNAEIIRQGYGHAYTKYPFGKMEEFRRFEREAAEAGKGLWAPDAVRTAAAFPEPGQTATATETVYVTRTGTKYHRAGCRSLSRSQIPMTLKEAAARYGACSLCRPPVLGDAAPPAHVLTPTAPAPPSATGSEASTPVMVSRTGTKYHRPGCRTLRGGGIASTLGEASKRYGPCSVCNPPVLSTAAPAAAPAASSGVTSPAPSRPAVTSGRCQAITKKGTQCSRSARPGSNYCWQHGG